MHFFAYSRFTDIDSIFNIGVKNLQYLKYVWEYYFWGLYIFAFLTLVVLIAFRDKKRRGDPDETELRELQELP